MRIWSGSFLSRMLIILLSHRRQGKKKKKTGGNPHSFPFGKERASFLACWWKALKISSVVLLSPFIWASGLSDISWVTWRLPHEPLKFLSADPQEWQTGLLFSGQRMEILFPKPAESPGTEAASPESHNRKVGDLAPLPLISRLQQTVLIQGGSALNPSQPWLLVPIKKQLQSQQFKAEAQNTTCWKKQDRFLRSSYSIKG